MRRPVPWFARRGEGPPLALLPGGPGMASDYLEPVADLAKDSYQVILIDPPGCGRSPLTGDPDIAGLIAAIEDVRVELGVERWAVGGHSFGADLALACALEQPTRAMSVIAIAPTGVQDDREWHRRYEEGREAGRDQVPDSQYPLDEGVHTAGLASWRRFVKQPDLLRRLAQLPVPYLAVLGSDDVRPSWPVEQVARLVPRGRVITIDGAGHCPWWTHSIALREAMLATSRSRRSG